MVELNLLTMGVVVEQTMRSVVELYRVVDWFDAASIQGEGNDPQYWVDVCHL